MCPPIPFSGHQSCRSASEAGLNSLTSLSNSWPDLAWPNISFSLQLGLGPLSYQHRHWLPVVTKCSLLRTCVKFLAHLVLYNPHTCIQVYVQCVKYDQIHRQLWAIKEPVFISGRCSNTEKNYLTKCCHWNCKTVWICSYSMNSDLVERCESGHNPIGRILWEWREFWESSLEMSNRITRNSTLSLKVSHGEIQ